MTVSGQIIEVLDAICEKFGIVIDWTSANILPYIQELAGKFITYEIATSIAWIVIPVVICSVFFGMARYGLKKDIDDLFYPGMLIGCGVAIVGILIIITQTFDIITCVTFPEKILIREIQEIMRTMK